jgi:hypothetical protein
MSSAADMLEVGCPEPAPVLERMLSTRSCCASERHCSAPMVSWFICCVTTYLLDGTAVPLKTDCILFSYPASVVQKLCAAQGSVRGLRRAPNRVQITPSCQAIERTRRSAWGGETEATNPVGDVGAGMADVETDPEASAIVPVRAVVVAGIRNGQETTRIAGKSASNAARSARSTGRSARSIEKRGRTAGKSASNAERTASKRVAEIPAVGETPNAGEGPDSTRASLRVGGLPRSIPAGTTKLYAIKADRRTHTSRRPGVVVEQSNGVAEEMGERVATGPGRSIQTTATP